VPLTLQVNLRTDVKEIINWLYIIQGKKFISLLQSHFVPESFSLSSVLDKSNAEPTRRVLKGLFIKILVKLNMIISQHI